MAFKVKSLQKRKDKDSPFEIQMMNEGRLGNITTVIVLLAYIFYFSGLPSYITNSKQLIILFAIIIGMLILLQFGLAPRTNHLITNRISLELESFRDELYNGNTKDDEIKKTERTLLLKNILSLPQKISLQVSAVFFAGFSVLIALTTFYLKMSFITNSFVGASIICGTYFAGLISYNYATRLCTEYTIELSKHPLDRTTIEKDHYYGPSTKFTVWLYIIIPVFLTFFLSIFYTYILQNSTLPKNIQILNLILLTIMNVGICVFLVYFVYFRTITETWEINTILEKFVSGQMNESVHIPSSMNNELSYNIFIINESLTFLQSIIKKANTASIGLKTQTLELMTLAEKIQKSSESLSSILEKTSSTMTENVKTQINEISINIGQVGFQSEETKNNVDTVFGILKDDIQKNLEISQANIETISKIRELSEMIDKVWNSIKNIDLLASKTRIIAFNAELEATAAGERGENFHIVANEIRRLADTITDSTYEIKEKIKSIQHSSDNLIVTSEGGTQKIREGSLFFSELNERFQELKLKSDITAEYGKDIQTIIQNQDASFIQINSALAQINAGFLDFTNSTKTLTDSAESLNNIVQSLSIYSTESKEE